MNRLIAALAVTAALLPCAAAGAEITRIATSFEDTDPFGMYLSLNFEHTQQRSRIVRERHLDGDVRDVGELRYRMLDTRVNFDARIGLWTDLELRYSVPYVFARNELWTYDADAENGANSSILQNCIDARGQLYDPDCLTTGEGQQALFPTPHGSYRGGFGNMTFGLAYAIFNQRRDSTKPVWIVGFDYEAPTAARNTVRFTIPSRRGALGDRVHKYKLYTTMSRQMGLAEPYFQFHHTLPYRGPGWYSNCENPDPQYMAYPENCFNGSWNKSDQGINAPQVSGVVFGSEFVAWEDKPKAQRVALDLRLFGTYVGAGRYYNELSGLTYKLIQTPDYAQVGGHLVITAQAAEFLTLRATGMLGFTTDHLLSVEPIAKSTVLLVVDPTTGELTEESTAALNPSYDFRTDVPSRRFRLTETNTYRLDLTATFSF